MITEEELYDRIFDLEKQILKLEEENEDLREENNQLKELIEDIEQDRDDNYKPIPKNVQYDVYDNMFI